MSVFLCQSKAIMQRLMISRVLKPGGWVQMIEYYYMCQSDNGSLTEASPVRQWSQRYMQAMEISKEPRAGLRLRALLAEAGFVDIKVEMIRVPLCPWIVGRAKIPHPTSRGSPQNFRNATEYR